MGNTQSEICTQEQIRFTVNGKLNIVGPEVGVETRLVRFIREGLHMTGTKFSCGQGGCGACTVTVTARDPGSGLTKTRAVNSCLVPVLSCDGWEISTVESLGNKKDGFHPLQSRLAKFNGSQCGFCSPGMIMATNSLLHENESPNMKEIEHCLDGNICRCTGFRPILDAMKSFAGESEEICKSALCEDIEDLAGWVCPKKNTLFASEFEHGNILVRDKNKTWISPNNLETLFDSLEIVIPMVADPFQALDPVFHLRQLFTTCILPDHLPAFSFIKKGKTRCITYTKFTQELRKLLDRAGYRSKSYSGHSFRRGGATYLYRLGADPLLIQASGDRASDCYQSYVQQQDKGAASRVQEGFQTSQHNQSFHIKILFQRWIV